MSAQIAQMPDTVTTMARRIQAEATRLTGERKRGTMPELYSVLANALWLVELGELDHRNEEELRELVLDQPHEGNRRYVEKSSDLFVLVCRYVFHRDTRANASRYSHCLRQAARAKIHSDELVHHLTHHGGLNSLYMARPVERTTTDTKCLRLTESITCPKEGRFTVTLERMPDNTYKPWKVET